MSTSPKYTTYFIFLRIFLRIQTRLLSDEKLQIQLSKRGHNLDKKLSANQKDNLFFLFLFELEFLLEEWSRRGLQSTSITKWVWELIYNSKFHEMDVFNQDSQESVNEFSGYNFLEVVKNRRSVRLWSNKAVDKKDILKAIEYAKWAPCSCNRQLWKFLIVETDDDVEFLKLFSKQTFYKKAPIVIIPLIKITEYGEEEKHYADLDMGAIIQNLLLIFHSQGLGACWIGIQRTSDFYANKKEFCKRFGIDDSFIPTSLIPVGYPQKQPFAPPRKNTDDMVIFR